MSSVDQQRPLFARTKKALPALFFMLLLVAWVIPMGRSGAFKHYTSVSWLSSLGVSPHVEGQIAKYVNNMYACSCLFTYSQRNWSEYYIEARLVGEETWFEVPESAISEALVFGYRTRFHRMYQQTTSKVDTAAWARNRQVRLAQEIHKRIESGRARGPWLNSEDPRVAEIRFIWVWHRVGSKELVNPYGPWKRKALSEVPANRRRVASTHSFENGQDGVARRTKDKPKTTRPSRRKPRLAKSKSSIFDPDRIRPLPKRRQRLSSEESPQNWTGSSPDANSSQEVSHD